MEHLKTDEWNQKILFNSGKMDVLQEHTVSSHIVYYGPFFVYLSENTNPCNFSDTKQQCSAARAVVICNHFFIHNVTGP